MNVSYDYYKIFYYVVKFKSFTLAADYLYNSQPNITRAVKKLEEIIGCTLLVRSNRGVVPTPEGERLYSHISVAMEHIQAGEYELSAQKDLQSGFCVISVTEIALHCHVLGVLKRFHKSFPNVRLKLSDHSTVQAISAVKSGISDLAVVSSPFNAERPLETRTVKKVKEVAVAGMEFQKLFGGVTSLAELAKYPMIMLDGRTASRGFYSSVFEKSGVSLTPSVEVSSIDRVLPLVKQGLGIGFVPRDFLGEDPEKDGVVIIDTAEKIPPRDICLVKNSARISGFAAKKLEEMILCP